MTHIGLIEDFFEIGSAWHTLRFQMLPFRLRMSVSRFLRINFAADNSKMEHHGNSNH